jgi:hypothetical protein
MPAQVHAVATSPALTPDAQDERGGDVADQTRTDHGHDEPRVQRTESPMIGTMHAGCAKAEVVFGLVDQACFAWPAAPGQNGLGACNPKGCNRVWLIIGWR